MANKAPPAPWGGPHGQLGTRREGEPQTQRGRALFLEPNAQASESQKADAEGAVSGVAQRQGLPTLLPPGHPGAAGTLCALQPASLHPAPGHLYQPLPPASALFPLRVFPLLPRGSRPCGHTHTPHARTQAHAGVCTLEGTCPPHYPFPCPSTDRKQGPAPQPCTRPGSQQTPDKRRPDVPEQSEPPQLFSARLPHSGCGKESRAPGQGRGRLGRARGPTSWFDSSQ